MRELSKGIGKRGKVNFGKAFIRFKEERQSWRSKAQLLEVLF